MSKDKIYNEYAWKRDCFIKQHGRNIKIKGVKGNQYFLKLCHKQLIVSRSSLEIGTGTGVIPQWLGHLKKRLVCVDNSWEMLKIARKNCAGFKNIRFVKANLNHLPFKKNKFSLVIKRLAPDNLKEITRVLGPGGVFLNLTNGEKDGLELKKLFKHQIHESVKEYRKKLIKSSLTLVKEKEFVFQEIYNNLSDLVNILEITPLVPDFNKRRTFYLRQLGNYFLKQKKFILTRHKYVTYAIKSI